MTMTDFDPVAARARLLDLVRERAYKDGLDIVLASGKRSTFYIQGKKITLHPEGLYLLARLLLEDLKKYPQITSVASSDHVPWNTDKRLSSTRSASSSSSQDHAIVASIVACRRSPAL